MRGGGNVRINEKGKLVVKDHDDLEVCIYLSVALEGYNCDLNFIDPSQINYFLFTFETNSVTEYSRKKAFKLLLASNMDTVIHPLDVDLKYFNGYINEWSFKEATHLKEMFIGNFNRHDLIFDCEKLKEIENLFKESDFDKKVIFKHPLPNLESISCAFDGVKNIEYIQLDLTKSKKLKSAIYAFSGIKNQHNALKGVKFPLYKDLKKMFANRIDKFFPISNILDFDRIELKKLKKDNPSLLKFLQDIGIEGKNAIWSDFPDEEYILKSIDFYIDERYFSEESVANGITYRCQYIFGDTFEVDDLKDILLDKSELNEAKRNLLIKIINTKYFKKHYSSVLKELEERYKEIFTNLTIDILNKNKKDLEKEFTNFNRIRV